MISRVASYLDSLGGVRSVTRVTHLPGSLLDSGVLEVPGIARNLTQQGIERVARCLDFRKNYHLQYFYFRVLLLSIVVSAYCVRVQCTNAAHNFLKGKTHIV